MDISADDVMNSPLLSWPVKRFDISPTSDAAVAIILANERIARALKKAKSSIYYYFGSKEEIFEAVVLYEANQLRKQLTTAIKEVESPQEKLRNYIYVRMKAFAKLSNYYNAVFDKNLDHYEFIVDNLH